MAGRGRGRGRGIGRGTPFTSNDQLNPLPIEKVSSIQQPSLYPPLEFYPARLSTEKDYDDLLKIREQLRVDFQTSNYHLKAEDEHSKLFMLQREKATQKKASLKFYWDFFPLELRPTAVKKRKKCDEMLANLRKNNMTSVDLSWLDKLEEKENDATTEKVVMMEEEVKKESEENQNEENQDEVEEFDDEELDMDTDYNTTYFDNGEGYLDEDDALDEGPCF